ncbi:MAG: helix-turn-helix transcriptional regulator [Burkholderiales bacterium]|nr:helix-turn-helix transcriptional regulator [Burkholderiales bacterium]
MAHAQQSPSEPPYTLAEAQLVEDSERADGPAVIAFVGDHEPDSDFPLDNREHDWHSHVRGQLFCVESGLVHVRSAHGSWMLPPLRAGWIPPGVPHWVSITGVLSGWCVLIAPHASAVLPSTPCVIGVSELLRALVQRCVTWAGTEHLSPEQDRITAVLLDELCNTPHQPLHLPLPTDRRLLRIAKAVLKNPSDTRTLEQWAQWAGMSSRTLSRLCVAQTGSSFAQWRQQAGLTHALELLAQGRSVADVADALGYASPSNFIAMFRRSFGESPGRFFAKTPPRRALL